MQQFGIDDGVLNTFISMYSSMSSCVRNGTHMSDFVYLKQGTRQGRKSYPLLYLLFIDGLIKEIELSQHGMCIYGMNAACLTVADDMVLISFSKKGLQHLMDMCYRYSLRWRFEYNPSKCSVFVFNESRVAFERSDRSWCLGKYVIPESTKYTHLGCVIDKFGAIKDSIRNSCAKIKTDYA